MPEEATLEEVRRGTEGMEGMGACESRLDSAGVLAYVISPLTSFPLFSFLLQTLKRLRSHAEWTHTIQIFARQIYGRANICPFSSHLPLFSSWPIHSPSAVGTKTDTCHLLLMSCVSLNTCLLPHVPHLGNDEIVRKE